MGQPAGNRWEILEVLQSKVQTVVVVPDLQEFSLKYQCFIGQ